MSLVAVSVTWTLVGNGGGGNVATGKGLWFDTDTKQISEQTQTRQQAILDPKPADVHAQVGELLYYECDTAFTATTYTYGGGTLVNVGTEANSGLCGWTPPLTCDLGTASVSQLATAGGATLTFHFTGTVNGQACYSLDAGVEQTSPTFSSVPVGKHTLKLRDNALTSCERLVDVEIIAPAAAPLPPPAPVGASQGADFVGQPLWYALAGQPAGALVELELYAESAHGRDDFAHVLTMRKRANAQGQVSFRLDALLWPLLRAVVPQVGATVASLCTTNLVNYYVRTATTPLGSGAVPVLGVSALRTAVRGGLPAEWQDREYFRWRTLAFAYPPFLSWQPLGPGCYAAGQAKSVVAGQPEWLFYLCPLGLTDAQLRVKRTYAAGANSLPQVEYEPLARPGARGWAQRLLAIPLRTDRAGVSTLTVQLETTAGDPVSPTATFNLVEVNPRTRFLLLTNSLGGVDTLCCQGRLEGTLDAVAGEVELPAVAMAGAVPAADRQLSDLAASRKLKLATGWLSPAEWAWAQEVVLSRELWLLAGGQLLPLSAPKRSLAAYSDEPTLRGLLLEFDYAFAPTAYAPARA